MLGGLAAAAVTRAVLGAHARVPVGLQARLTRRNHAGAHVTLMEGPAVVAGATIGLLLAGAPRRDTVVVLVPGVLGAVDDLVGDTATKGLRGHLMALRSGRVTTGAAKVLGVGVVALLAAVLEPSPGRARAGPGRVAAVVLDAVVVGGAANLVNLLDLRPGRALKVAALLAVLGAPSGQPAAAVGGVVVGAISTDLGGRAMLGDCGANPLGALAGLGLVRTLPLRGRAVAAVALTGLTLLSERVSFTAVISRTPPLRRLDELGRPRPGRTSA